MNRRVIVPSSLVLLGCVAAAPTKAAAQEVKERPNILFILVDDFRYDALGYCGNPIVHTPAIDKLAEKGVFFKNAFASTPISSASRASILTGLQERTHRYSFQTGPIEDSFLEQAYPIALRNAGYNTALFGKLGVVCTDDSSLFDEIENYDRDDSCPDRRGYYYKTLGRDTVHLTRYTGQKALDYLDRQDKDDEPFFMAMCFSAPHAHDGAKEQYFWDKEQDHLFENVTVPDPAMSSDKDFKKLPEFLQNSFSRLRWTWRFDTPEKYQAMMKGYYRMIAGVDTEIEKVMAKLEEKNLDDNTVVIFLGDNGYFLGERQLADKWLMYDLSVRVPMIIYDPRVAKHKEVDCQTLNIDITSTIADYASADAQPQWQGKSLRPWVEQLAPDWDRDAILIEHLWEMPNIPPSEGVRTDKWKYFRYINDERVEELYNLEKDPCESKNLVADKRYSDVLAQMREKIEELKIEKSWTGSDAPFKLMVDRDASKSGASSVNETPTFGWKLPVRTQSQKGYQILVASSEEILSKNLGDVWSSGIVSCSSSASVKYAGAKLEKGKKYYWKVRVWDYINRTTEYSAPQQFTHMSPSDSRVEESTYKITKFEISKRSAPATLWGISSQWGKSSEVSIEPTLDGVNNSEIEISTLMGNIRCEYIRKSKLEEQYTVEIPSNMSVDFVLPKGLVGTVIFNKRVENLNHSTLQLKPGKNTIEIQVNTF